MKLPLLVQTGFIVSCVKSATKILFLLILSKSKEPVTQSKGVKLISRKYCERRIYLKNTQLEKMVKK